MAPTYKLTYFSLTALAEPMRMLMKYGGIEFEDDRFETANWPQLKPNMPFGQVPVLAIDDKVYHQSIAITRFLGRQVKLAGADDFEDLDIDIVVDTINDLRIKIAKYHYEADQATKDGLKDSTFNEIIPYYLERLEKIAEQNNGHLAAKKLTWADFYFVGQLDYLIVMAGYNLIEKYPNLEAVNNTVLAIPAIKEWVAVRPKNNL